MAADYVKVEKGIYLRGNVYYIAYSKNGKQYREPIHRAKSKTDARRALESRKGEIADNRFQGLQHLQTKFEDLIALKLDEYKTKDMDIWRLNASIKHLSKDFAGMKANNITTSLINKYIAARKKEGAANSTINKDLCCLRGGFKLAFEHSPRLVSEILKIPVLPENNIRKGFLEHEKYLRLREALPEYLKPSFITAYFTGVRKGELHLIEWAQYDKEDRSINLEPDQTKTETARILPLDDELFDLVLKQRNKRDILFPDCPYIFFNDEGKQIKNIYRAWDTALLKAGYSLSFRCKNKKCNHVLELYIRPSERPICPKCGTKTKRDDALWHDLRRSGIRNLIRSGVPESVAMKISGHKTNTVFKRYNIVDTKDLKDAAKKLSAYHKKKEAELSQP